MPLRDRLISWLRHPLLRHLHRCTRSLLFIPICVIIMIVLLGSLRLSGSSVGLVAENYPAQSAGIPRPNRSDEWRGRTPLVVRQAVNDFASETDVGMGVHDTGVLSDLPVKTLGSVIKPHTWIYFVVGVERAFAMEWWLTVFGPFLGVYALMAVLTKSSLISTLTGLLVAAAPTLTWWTVPSAGLSVFYGALTVAAFLAALRAPGRARFVYAGLSGWMLGCFVAMLYLPYLIPLALLFGAIALSQLRGHLGKRRPGKANHWIRLATIVGSGGAVFAIGMALYLRDHHTALATINDSVYPGHRKTTGAEAVPALMFDAPFDVFTTTKMSAAVYNTNESEAASGLMLWLPIAVAGGAFTGLRTRVGSSRALTAVMIISLLLVAWALLPIPDAIGAVTGLTRVQGSRLVLPLTVAAAIASGLYVHRTRTDGAFRPARARAVIATVTFAIVTGAFMARYVVDDVQPPRTEMILLVAVLSAATYALLRGRAALGLGGACALLLFSAVRVNPLQLGLGPLTASPMARQVAALEAQDPAAVWAVTGHDTNAVSIVTASGARSITGVSWYGDEATWRKIDPDGAQRDVWNRFAYVDMVIDETKQEATTVLQFADAISILTPTCNGALQALDVTYVVTSEAISSACLELVDAPDEGGERFIYTTALAPPD